MPGRENRADDPGSSEQHVETNDGGGAARNGRQPNFRVKVRTSKDGKYIMVDKIETNVFPTAYFKKIVANAENTLPPPPEPADSSFA